MQLKNRDTFNKHLYNEIINNISLAFFYYDTNGVIIDVNDSFVKLMGSTREKLIGLNTITQLKNKEVIAALKRSLEEGYAEYNGFYESVTGSATIIASGVFKRIYNEVGETIGGVCTIEDITNLEKYKKELELSNKVLKEEVEKNKKLLKELKITEQNYKAIFEQSPTPIIVHKNGKIILANKAAVEFSGAKSLDEVIGLSAFDFLHPDDYEVAIRHINEVVTKGKSSIEKERFYTLNKELRHVLVSTSNFIYNNENSILVNFLDVTKFKEYERKIEVISKGTDSLKAGFLITDSKGVVEYINEQFSFWLGLNKQEILNKDIYELKNYKFNNFFEQLNETIKTNNEWRGEIKIDKSYQNIEWVYCIISPVYNNNEIINYVAIIEDITQRKRIEQELIHREKYFSTLYENAPDGIFEIDKDAIILNCNKEFAKSVKLPKDKIIGKHASEFIVDKENFKTFFKKFFKEKFLEVEIKQLNGDGGSITVWRKVTALKGKNGNITGAIVFNRDVTERKKIENELIEAKNKAEEADKLKTAFLSNMSHEIRTPINAINGFSYILSKKELSLDKKEQYYSYIQSNSRLLLNLINDIIDLSKIEANQIKIKKENIDLNSLFHNIYNTYLIQHKDKKENFEFKLEVPNVSAQFYTDETRLRQIIVNLINNSLKFTENGYVKFGYKLSDNNIIIFVEDTGIGIPKDKLQTIFNRFTRIENRDKIKQGTGLGLSIVKQLTELLDGKIKINSESEKGTLFEIIFNQNMRSYKKENKTNIKLNDINKDSIPDWSDKKILIAEDDEFNFLVINEFLSETNIQIIRANNGEEAIELFNNDIDIVLMDIQMPKIDGLVATKTILKTNPNAKIIAQTAFALSNEKEESINAGCIDYITKPIDKDVIIEKISKYLK